MPDALSAINLRHTPQSQPADPRQVPNSAGGFTFTVAPVERLRRFLVLGTDGGTYYATERELTAANADVVLAWARDRCAELVDEVVAISTAGRAPRNNPALFALAAAAALGDAEGRKAALAALPQVARTGTHLFLFAGYVEQFRGWGRGLRRAVGRVVPVQAGRRGRLSGGEVPAAGGLVAPRPVASRPPGDRRGRPQAVVRLDMRPRRGWAGDRAGVPEGSGGDHGRRVGRDLDQPSGLSWEMLPDPALGEAEVWAKLIDNGVPQTALMRQFRGSPGSGCWRRCRTRSS